MLIDRGSKIVIVGAGCFGLSTAYHLLKRGFKHITILDRSPILPAPEAASTDLSKVVRSAYADPFYSDLAREAIAAWKNKDEWADSYRESGVVVVFKSSGESYNDYAFKNDVAGGAPVQRLENAAQLRAAFPGAPTVSFDGCAGYLNRDGGWALAAQGVQLLMARVEQLGARVLAGRHVVELMCSGARTTGVRCADGFEFPADLVVLCAGSWTSASFPGLDLGQKCVATGQSIALIQLSPEEVEQYRSCPVYMNNMDEFYCFPPNDEGIFKIATHRAGYTNMKPTSATPVSTPEFVRSADDKGSRIPKEAVADLRASLAKIYPALAAKSFVSTRLCWYTDSPDDNWVIGYHPADAGVMLATAGSGHAYKFLPVIGRIVADAIEGKLESELMKKFAFDRDDGYEGTMRRASRGGDRKTLDLNDLCAPEDLLPMHV
ncbi:FAD dependent oxidoreductase [Sparassis latifolia]